MSSAESSETTNSKLIASPVEHDPRAERSTKRKVWSKIWRFTVGGLVIVAGCLLSIPGVPGPGALIIIGGLAIIAPEWKPAERLLHWMRAKFDGAMRKAREKRSQRNAKR